MRAQFILEQLWKGLSRNVAMVVSVVIVTSMSLTFFGGGLLFQKQIDSAKSYWYDRVQVSIFLCTADSEAAQCAGGLADEEVAADVRAGLESPELAPYVEDVFFENREDAFERFLEQFENTPAITANVTEEQMPESFRVKLVDPERYEVIAQYFAGQPGVEEVVDQQELLDPVFRVFEYATWTAMALAVLMVVAAMLLVFTTIRLAAVSRRRELEIMRYVGASWTMLALPFLLEGIVAVTIGAALAVLTLWLIVKLLVQGVLSVELPIVVYIDTPAVWASAGWLFLVGIAVACVSSLVSLARSLRV
jgi:cell division transport system permease protein